MADDDITARPMEDGDIAAAPATSDFTPAVPLKSDGTDGGGTRQSLIDGAGKLQTQAGDKIREFADLGKERAGGALDQLATMLHDAAGQVDSRLGAQYGGYARSAADTVQSFSAQVKDQNLDELIDNARGFVRKSPGVAIGVAAAVGFVLARLAQSGIDADKA